MKIIIPILTAATFFTLNAYSQGCVALRSTGTSCNVSAQQADAGQWQVSMGYRYFKSFRHFKGKEEQEERLKQNTEVINWQHLLDLSVAKQINARWSVVVGLPIGMNKRSSLYEHGRTERHNTRSFGIGDMRIMAYRWMIDPSKHSKGNFQVCAGLKLPTGDYNYQDYFQNVGTGGTAQLRPVDQSIQLGDGGTGIITELNLFYILNSTRTISLYGNFYYLINPREQNGTPFTAGRVPPRIDSLANNIILSVPDQYSLRVGANFNFKNWIFSGGLRNEGIPVYDLFGGSEGLRRSGNNLSAEPGIVYKMKKASVYAYVPFIIARKIKQNVPDKFKTNYTGVYTVSPGGSGDYQVFVGVQFKF